MTLPALPFAALPRRQRPSPTVWFAALLCLANASCRLGPTAAPLSFVLHDRCDTRPCGPCQVPVERSCAPGPAGGPRDEYVCDGGDLGLRARVRGDWSIDGLELEDTVAHYDTLAGQVVVVPSNKTCVYSPRFAAARQVTRAAQNEISELAVRAEDQQAAVCRLAEEPADTFGQPVAAVQTLGGAMGHSLQEDLPGRLVDQVLQPEARQDALLPFQGERLLVLDALSTTEKAWLSAGHAAAVSWSAVELAQVIVDGTAVQATRSVREAEEAVVYSTPQGAQLRLIKLASRHEAHPGEIVEFTLRLENVGAEEVGNVTVVDHLSHRLEYVAGSQSCSVAAEFSVDEQTRPGMVVRWEITPPLPSGTAAVITFQCRVR